MKKYTQYNVEDFVLDEGFKNWVLSKNSVNGDGEFWEEWIEAHPEMKSVVNEARSIIARLEQTEEDVRVSREKIDEQYKEVAAFFDEQCVSESKRLSWSYVAKIAATILILVAAGMGIFYQFGQDEQKQVADNTTVVAPGSQTQSEKDPEETPEPASKTKTSDDYYGKTEEKAQSSESEKIASNKQNKNIQKEAEEGQTKAAVASDIKKDSECPGNSESDAFDNQNTICYTTNPGEQKKINLPDGSQVYLNEETRVVFAENWKAGTERKVRLTGEAYFDVKEKRYEGSTVKFVVATKDVNVEVVGTKFNVKEISPKTQVYLQSGKIMLGINDIGKTIEMNPSELLEYNPSTREFTIDNPDQNQYVSWVNNFDKLVREAKYYMKNTHAKQASNQDGNNVSRVFQNGENNQARIEQIGENNRSAQVQSGKNNRAETFISGKRDKNDEANWSTGQFQLGKGNKSFFNIEGSHNSNLFSAQAGKGNVVEATSEGEDNLGITIQFGQENKAKTEQDGIDNNVIILQKGAGNRVGMDGFKEGVIQDGENNRVKIIQHGVDNKARTIQEGRNNQVDVNQNGN